jgi:hypothetical protein
MANTKNVQDTALRKALKRAQRKRLKAVGAGLTFEQRQKLRRARAEKHIGLRQFLASQG